MRSTQIYKYTVEHRLSAPAFEARPCKKYATYYFMINFVAILILKIKWLHLQAYFH